MKRLALCLLLASCAKKPPPAPPPPATLSYETGKAALEAGHLDEAETIFRQIAKAPASDDPARPDNALLALASIRRERGDLPGALAFAEQVAAHRPQDTDALAVLIELAHENADLPKEIAAREKLVALAPDGLDDRLALAGALTAAKETERAKAAFLAYEDARVRLVTALGKSPDAATRRAAAEALGAAHDGGTARALVFAMTDKDAGVRAAAVRSVAAVGIDVDPEIRPALKKLSTLEKDPGVQAALHEALATPPGTK
jgi:tetratricopeptide (TPR) repeat protein